MKGSNRSFGAAVAAAVVMMPGVAGAASAQSGYVPLLLPENVNPRWESQDAAFFVEHMKPLAPDVFVIQIRIEFFGNCPQRLSNRSFELFSNDLAELMCR